MIRINEVLSAMDEIIDFSPPSRLRDVDGAHSRVKYLVKLSIKRNLSSPPLISKDIMYDLNSKSFLGKGYQDVWYAAEATHVTIPSVPGSLVSIVVTIEAAVDTDNLPSESDVKKFLQSILSRGPGVEYWDNVHVEAVRVQR